VNAIYFGPHKAPLNSNQARPQRTCTENFAKFRHAIFFRYARGKQTYRHADHSTLHLCQGQSN